MILEFVDKSQIEVDTIYGGPVNVSGTMRDVLTIEIKPKSYTIDGLNEIFKNVDNLAHLYTYEKNSKVEIGEGYTIVLEVARGSRKVKTFPGRLLPNRYEDIYRVQIAQMTYEEWINSKYAPKSINDNPNSEE